MSLADNPSSIAAVQDRQTSQRIEEFEYRYDPTSTLGLAEAAVRAAPASKAPLFPQTAGVYGALHHDALTHSWMDDNARTLRSLSMDDIANFELRTPASEVKALNQQAPSTYQAGRFQEYYGQNPEVVARRAEAAGMGYGAPWYDVGSTHEYSLYQKDATAGLLNRKSIGCILAGAGTVGVAVALSWYLMARRRRGKK